MDGIDELEHRWESESITAVLGFDITPLNLNFRHESFCGPQHNLLEAQRQIADAEDFQVDIVPSVVISEVEEAPVHQIEVLLPISRECTTNASSDLGKDHATHLPTAKGHNKEEAKSKLEDSNEQPTSVKEDEAKLIDELALSEGSQDVNGGKHSLRRDVLFKNILRSVKKHYANLFKSTTTFFAVKSKTQRKKIAMSHVQEFVRANFSSPDFEEMYKTASFEEVCNYIGRIVVPEYFSKTYCSYECAKYTDLLYSCIYKYTQANADKLYKSTVLRSIYGNFFKSATFYEMLNSDSTLCRNKEHYLAKAKEVVKCFDKRF